MQAYNLPEVSSGHIEDGLASALLCRRFHEAGRHVIRSIHGIPRLFEGVSLGSLEVYLGRSGATPKHVKSRFRDHLDEKRHEFGMILVVGDTENIVTWEGIANHILLRLKDRGLLCVANLAAGGHGNVPECRYSCIYMTWRVARKKQVAVATRRDIVDISEEIADDYGVRSLEESLTVAMDSLSRPSRDYADLIWHREHER